MAYTTNQAIAALNCYLGISDSDKEIIPKTKNRGFIYTLDSGEKVVIFVYPIVHKQDNTKNYFDTRDSGALERGITWNYSIKNKMKYFCLGINDSVDKYKDYVFSLECSEHVIEILSGTKNGTRNGPGNQIIIPNDYTPKKSFERITNKIGTYISVIRKDKLIDYLTAWDNRPYMVDAAEVELSMKSVLEEYEALDLDSRKQAFISWMKTLIKPEGKPYGGQPYSEGVIASYANALANAGERLDGFTCENKNFFCFTDDVKFTQAETAAKKASNYEEIDKKYINHGLSAAFKQYHDFLSSLQPEEEEEMESNKELKTCQEIKRNPRTITIHPLNFIIYGAPGTGKTYSTAEYALAIIENRPVDIAKKTVAERIEVMKKYNELVNKGQIVFTTFHQSYGYEEFIQGLRPDTSAEHMSFKTIDGVFKHISDVALNDNDNNYVIIIDEINRANISKVFGELITLIEDDKRWGEVNETCATLQSGDVFAVPNNLYIVGTMNSADKSISLIDAALRRRFSFIEQQPDDSLVSDPVLRKVLHEMNIILARELDSTDLLVGHSYFMNKGVDDLCGILNNNIIPLLYEYFYDNRKKVASVLNEVISKAGADIEIEDSVIGRLSAKTKGNTDDSEQV